MSPDHTCTAAVVALALDGWVDPGAASGPDAGAVVEAHRRWRAGARVREIAQILGVTPSSLRDQLRTGEMVLLPERVGSAGLCVQFGWTRSAQSLYRRKGVLPPPDGQDGRALWWWQETIDSWVEATELYWCPDCHHAFVAAAGAREHWTRVHG